MRVVERLYGRELTLTKKLVHLLIKAKKLAERRK
jgi:hypothetical protein